MNVYEIYTMLKRSKLVANHLAFSVDYLNKGPRYFDHLICSHRRPSISALMALYIRVNAVATALTTSSALNSHVVELKDLAHAIWMELEQRSCALLPANRKRPAPVRVIQGAVASSAPPTSPGRSNPYTSSTGFDPSFLTRHQQR